MMSDTKNDQGTSSPSPEGLKIRKKDEAATPAEAPRVTPTHAEVPAAPKADAPAYHASSQDTRGRVARAEAPAPRTQDEAPLELTTIEQGATTEDFAALFAQTSSETPLRRYFAPGERVKGRVAHIDTRFIHVDLGSRAEGRAGRGQFTDAEGELELRVGDEREFYVLSANAEGVELGKRMDQSAGLDGLLDAMAGGIPVLGKVTARNKGGFDVDVLGTRAFCPLSQIDLYNQPDPDVYIGQSFEFRVQDVREDGRNVVVSRAALLREQQDIAREQTMKALEVGAVLNGKVRSLMDFGAFVDLGGMDGLIHISEMSWSNVGKPDEIVSEGQELQVKVLSIEQRAGEKAPRIALSLKQLDEDPWEQSAAGLSIGQELDGVVARLTHFGAFVELLPGVDGLVHISEMSWKHIARPSDVVSVGDRVSVQIVDIDLARRRIALSMKEAKEDPWTDIASRYEEGQQVQGVVEKIEDFGVFVNLGEGLTALLPRSEMALAREQSPHSIASQGQVIEARVLTIDVERRRMALTRREGASAEPAPRRERPQGDATKPKRQASAPQQAPQQQGGFGTLGDLIKFNQKK